MPEQLTPADIDAIRIAHDNRTLGLIGMALTVYLPEPHRPHVRSAVAACIEEYRALVKGKLKKAVFRKSVIAEPACPAVTDLAKETGEREAFTILFTGADALEEVSHYNLQTLLPARVSYERVGEISITFPVSDLATRPPGTFQQIAERWCRTLAPVHGYGGFSVVRSIDDAHAERAEPFLYPIVGRFPGLEIDQPAAHIRWCVRGTKGVNWLTILSRSLVERLGGEGALKQALSSGDIQVRGYGNGVIIQAGPHPQLGDADSNYIPASYQRVYRAVKAVQAEYPDIIMQTPDGVDALEFAQRWLHRFD